jgi:tripartite-type tricarboxylate transporter receptor subunit TctC
MRSVSNCRIASFAVVTCAFASVLGATAARADSVEDFYSKSKHGSMIIGSSAGGGYDQYARLVAHYIGAHIPGHPDIIPRNMPGASGRKALEYVANVAPADGLTIGMVTRNTHFDKLLNGDESIKVDPTKLSWLGSANSEVSTCVSWHTTGLKTIDDLRTKGMTIGASGPTATDLLEARLLNKLAGTHIKTILGYPGSTEEHLAMERGELQGRCGLGWDSIVSRYPQWLEKKQINILAQLASEKAPELPNVPLLNEFAKTDTERQMLRVFEIPNEMGRPFFMRGGIPEERVTALRAAFDATMKDPKLLADAKRQHLAIIPLNGAKVAAMVKEVYATPADALALARDIINSEEKLEVRKEHFYTVDATLKSVEPKGKGVGFEEKGKIVKAVITGGHTGTKVTIAGKEAKGAKLAAGMSCSVTYEGNLSVAKSIACK